MKMAKANRKRVTGKFWPLLIAVIFLLAAGGIVGLRVWYDHNLQPVSSSTKIQYFTVESGASAQQIAKGLQSSGLIRSSRAFIAYLNTKEYRDKLQAGTYKLSASMSAQQIADKMYRGDVAKNLLTILPGKHLDDIKKTFLAAGYSSAEVDSAFNPSNYPALASTVNLPSGATLEGLLYPDSFQHQSNTPASVIVQESIDETLSHISDQVISGFQAHGLNVYQGITLASIVVQESDDPHYEPTVAQVFLSRLRQQIPLQSNVTADYAADLAGVPRNVNIESPYNTYLHAGLPPGPIGTVTGTALNAVANPDSTDYLYFVAGDDGVVHFSHTEAEHEAAISQYCKKLCQQ